MMILTSMIVFVFGLCIGSFLNVCIFRMGREQSIIKPGSHCTACLKPIRWYDNIPLVSYLLLRGRCRDCGVRFSFRYFFVELLTGLLFLAIYGRWGMTPPAFIYAALCAGLTVATFIDFDFRIIPDEISVGGAMVGLILSFFVPALHDTSDQTLAAGRLLVLVLLVLSVVAETVIRVFHLRRESDTEPEEGDGKFFIWLIVLVGIVFLIHFLQAFIAARSFGRWPLLLRGLESGLIGFLVGGGILLILGDIGDLIFRKESMGGGDIKLLAMVGSFLGWQMALLALPLASVVGAVVGVVIKIRTKESVIAFGPYLAMGAVACLFWGQQILGYFFNL